jgi:serine/threonine protein kinase/tetratricopeptide (TPR) repeat protein
MSKKSTTDSLIGREIGGCRIKSVLGTGGMGAVYLADQVSLGKEVALKILDERWAAKAEHVEGFLREARLAARLEDEHIVQIYDVGTDGTCHYIVMQLARGESLRDRLRKGALDVDEALKQIEGVARGLSVAHRFGIVHRDIKPGNLVLGDDGIIKILDFGLARAEDAESRKSEGQFMGSIAYMAPEQSEYMPVDARTDIYSLGVTAFQCLTGQLPFRGENNFDLLIRHHCEQPVAPSVARPEVPLTVSRVVLRMLAKDPDVRYQSVDDLLVDLKLMRRHQLPVTPLPWGDRPLNPPGINAGGKDAQTLYRAGLKSQREEFTQGMPVTPLRELLPGMGVTTREAQDQPLTPPSFLELRCGNRRLTLAEAAEAGFEPPDCGGGPTFTDRFRVFPHEERLVVRVRGHKALGLTEVQGLFDLLEALPGSFRQIAVALEQEYTVQGSDIRWVVDTYNLLDKRGCRFTLIVGSMENHTTFVNLGIDSHIALELELDGPATVSLERLRPDAEAAPEAAPAAEPEALTPSMRALVARVRELMDDHELVEAARAWRRLVNEGISRDQLEPHRNLRDDLFERLLAQGKEAYEADDYDTATERFNLLIDLAPGRYEGHFYKGLLMKSEGKLEYAQAFLTQAILAAPDESELFYHRAIVRSRVDDLEGALRDLDMALQHNPRMTNAYYNRAKLHRRMGRNDLMKRDLAMYERLRGERQSPTDKQPSPQPTTGQA